MGGRTKTSPASAERRWIFCQSVWTDGMTAAKSIPNQRWASNTGQIALFATCSNHSNIASWTTTLPVFADSNDPKRYLALKLYTQIMAMKCTNCHFLRLFLVLLLALIFVNTTTSFSLQQQRSLAAPS